ncbi:elongation factor G [Clostridium perfringens]|uniref:elongation factor G n=1 Tax=Clostridium perfringens TaxID=1502 RepID=UPI0018E456CC|nr:TetM/TetW/TetO/TetS family tetracycline resistance ribosomal protection protein [Clostridium perfringens]MBI6038644.1 TetM/TetW/TetO/TetS family tetracycline resistance ribosomal protection protein [Clostridium perfringens]
MKKTIGILAHVDGGKTTFSEQLLYHTKSIRNRGRVDHKNSYLDNNEIERDRGITIYSEVGRFSIENQEYYLIDTPGHIDFSPEMERAISVLDYAILIISAVEGVQGHSETIWELLNKYKVPTFIFINKIDREGAEVNKIINEMKKKLSEDIIFFSSKLEDETIEEVVERDEDLLNLYLEGNLSEEKLLNKIQSMIKELKIFPCLCGSALLDEGVEDFIRWFHNLSFTNYEEREDSFKGRVFKVRHDEKGNRLTFIKALEGTLRTKEELTYLKEGKEFLEKVNEIRIYNGSKYELVNEVKAGDIFAVVGVKGLESGDGIGIENIDSYDMVPTLKSKVLYRDGLNPKEVLSWFKILESEESTLSVSWDERLKEIQVNIMGKVQLEVLKEVMKNRFNEEIEFGTPEILYKETLNEEVIGYGHFEPLGHYSEVHLKIEPLERNSGIVFENKCHADDLTVGNQNLIRTHIFECEHKGILTGSPITDLKITLLTGRAHNKHTSGGDFREATKRALRQGLESGENKLLEPYYKFKIDVDINLIGRVMNDIQKMHGEFKEPIIDGERAIIEGNGPVSTFINYGMEFQSFTKGKGGLFLKFHGYDLCHNEEEIIEKMAYDRNADIDYTSTSIFCSKGQAYLVKGEEAKEHMHCLV